MNSRERVIRAIAKEPVDRVPMTDAMWKETIVRWREEGLPDEKHPHDYFEFDIRYSYFLDTSPMVIPREIERTEEYVVAAHLNSPLCALLKGTFRSHEIPQ